MAASLADRPEGGDSAGRRRTVDLVVSDPPRRLDAQEQEPSLVPLSSPVCPVTGVTIPECSCRRCVDEMIRHHSPLLLDRRFGGGSNGRHAA
jgi:hypothetical protein